MTAAPGVALRAGRLFCVCPPGAEAGPSGREGAATALHAAGFALTVLAQAVTLSLLPLVGLLHAPSPGLAAWPYAAFYVGSTAATFPASFLLDRFGRHAAFALGSSLGAAGGLILAFGIAEAMFPALVVGAFWLGIASGFGLFHRHAAGALHPRAAAAVFGAGAIAGLAAPALTGTMERLVTVPFAGTAMLAALAQVAALALAFALPAPLPQPRPRTPAAFAARPFLVATLIGMAAWLVMAALMGATPLALAGCGIAGPAVTGLVSWHVLAMYAPALVAAHPAVAARPRALLALGVALLLGAGAAFALGSDAGWYGTSLVLVGIGWCLTTIAATLVLHRDGEPPRWAAAAHDFALFAAAVLGAVLSARLV